MKRWRLLVIFGLLLSLVLVACGGDGDVETAGEIQATEASEAPEEIDEEVEEEMEEEVEETAEESTEEMAEEEMAASVSFTSPADGDTVTSPVHVTWTADHFTIEPAGAINEGAGHLHVLIDVECSEAGNIVPADDSHLHFGDGQTETELELEPGEHTLCLQAADGIHTALDLTHVITITVEEGEAMEEEMEEGSEEMAEEETTEEEMSEEEMAEMPHCSEDLTGETIVLHQQAGREGPLAAILGEAFFFATQDAVAAINDGGGVCGAMIEVAFKETNYDVEQEVAAYEEFRAADPKPIVLFTYASGATVALKDRVIEDQIVNFAAGVNGPAIYVPRNGYTIAGVPIYSDQFAGFAQWLSDNWADVKPESAGDEIVIGVIGWANAFGAGATTPEALEYIEGLGITVLPLEEQTVSPEADVSGQIQNLLINGANVIYNQNLSFSVAQVIGAVRGLGVWDDVVVGGVGWSFNSDVINFLGENAALADGYYGVVPHATWNDTDLDVIQEVLDVFEAAEYPDTERTNTYLLTYATFFAVRDILIHAINTSGYDSLSGQTFLAAAQDMGIVDARGLFSFDLRGENRAPNRAHIRQWQAQEDGSVVDVAVSEFFDLPDTRPPAEE